MVLCLELRDVLGEFEDLGLVVFFFINQFIFEQLHLLCDYLLQSTNLLVFISFVQLELVYLLLNIVRVI